MTDQDIAQLIRRLEVDIAIDLMGFTEGSRTDIFAQRAAPIQINYLGYPGTMGAPYIRLTTPLFDTKRFIRHIEAASTEAYRRYQAGLQPDHIQVPQ